MGFKPNFVNHISLLINDLTRRSNLTGNPNLCNDDGSKTHKVRFSDIK